MYQWNMLPARLAVLQTPNSTREKTDCTSSPATPAVRDEVLPPSRPVSLPKSARDADSRARKVLLGVLDYWVYERTNLSVESSGRILSISFGS
jgi:hypothetical protein